MRHYAIHHRSATFREFVRLSHPNSLRAALIWLPLKLGIIQWQTQTVSFPESIRETIVPVPLLPEPARAYMLAVLPQMVDRGFVDPIVEVIRSTGTEGEKIVGTCLRSRHTSGKYILQTLFSFNELGENQAQYQLVTFLVQDRTLATVNGRPTLDRIPGASATYHPHADLTTLISLHDCKVAELDTHLIWINNLDEMVLQVDALATRYFKHMLQRGILTEVSLDGDAAE